MRIRNTIALVLGLCLGAALAIAQPIAGLSKISENEADPCANIGTPSNPYTMGNCWNCYTSKIKDCDRQFGEPAARQACYTGATSLLTFCLNQTVPANPSTPKPKGHVAITGQSLTYQVQFEYEVLPGTIHVLRAQTGREILAHVWYNGNEITVTIDEKNLPGTPGIDFGLITAVSNGQGFIGAEAWTYRTYSPADLDLDGVVDMSDLIIAMDSDIDFEAFFDEFVR